MDIQSLIRLANQADIEGNYRVADKLTEKVEKMTRVTRFGNLSGSFGRGTASGFGAAADAVADATADATADARAIGLAGGIHINTGHALPGAAGAQGLPGAQGAAGAAGAAGAQGLQGLEGARGKAGAWWPGVLAGLASGALTAVGVGAYLKSQGASDDVVRSISQQVNSPDFKANQLAARSSKDQMKQQAAAQNFIEANKNNPKFKTAQDFYYAAQAAGMNQSMMNQIAALAKSEGFRDLTRFQD